MSYLLGLLLLAWMGTGAAQRLRTRRRQLLRQDRLGPIRSELRRHIEWVTHPDGMGGASFPCPREVRCRTLSFAGVEFWAIQQSIGLPANAEERLDRIGADEFDSAFTPRFSVGRSDKATHLHPSFSA
jgi:hypothetical protein